MQPLSPADKKRLELIKLKYMVQKQLDECFDPNNLESRPQGIQLECLKDGENNIQFIIGPNRSGKSQIGSRAVSWWLQDKHPYIPARKEWGKGYKILVVGRTTAIMENELWEGKIKKFLPSGSYREKRGSTLEFVEHHETKNRIIFLSHHDAANAREKVQGFTAPIVWLDEMPDDSSLLTELMVRTITAGGILIATFTPLVENEEVKKIVEAPAPGKKKCVLKLEDNPIMKSQIEEYDARLRSMSATEAEYRARRYGEWYYRSGRVVRAYDPNKHKIPLPEDYSPLWRHVVVVDPSASGLTGLTVWAESPVNYQWSNILAKTLEGDAAYLLVKKVEEEVEGLNIVKRICDCNPAGFYKEALRQNIRYLPVQDKVDRKNDMIEGLNRAIVDGRVVLTEASSLLEEECLSCKWSETDRNKIVHSSKWHLIDTMRYFVDKMPPPAKMAVVYRDEMHARKQAHYESQEKKQKEAKKQRMKLMKKTNSRWSGRRRVR